MNLKVVVRRQSGNRLIQRSIVKNLIGNGVPPNYRALHPYSYHNDYRKFPRFRFPWGLFLGESPKSTITYLSMDQQETIIIEDTTTDDPNGKSERSPSLWFVHATAIFVQILFGVGNCIGKEALNSMPPIIFAFYRELFAGLILLSICVNDIRFFSLVVHHTKQICSQGRHSPVILCWTLYVWQSSVFYCWFIICTCTYCFYLASNTANYHSSRHYYDSHGIKELEEDTWHLVIGFRCLCCCILLWRRK